MLFGAKKGPKAGKDPIDGVNVAGSMGSVLVHACDAVAPVKAWVVPSGGYVAAPGGACGDARYCAPDLGLEFSFEVAGTEEGLRCEEGSCVRGGAGDARYGVVYDGEARALHVCE